jgi:hypothetical protein
LTSYADSKNPTTVYVQDGSNREDVADNFFHEDVHSQQAPPADFAEFDSNEIEAYGSTAMHQAEAGRPGRFLSTSTDPTTKKNVTRIDNAAIRNQLLTEYPRSIDPKTGKPFEDSHSIQLGRYTDANFRGVERVSMHMVHLAYEATAAKAADKVASAAEKAAKKVAGSKTATAAEKAAAKMQRPRPSKPPMRQKRRRRKRNKLLKTRGSVSRTHAVTSCCDKLDYELETRSRSIRFLLFNRRCFFSVRDQGRLFARRLRRVYDHGTYPEHC